MPRIEPTVGRVLLYHTPNCGKPLAATVAAVNEDGTINIGFLDSVGNHCAAVDVPLMQEGEGTNDAEAHFCTWPQIGQAAKTEKVEAVTVKHKK